MIRVLGNLIYTKDLILPMTLNFDPTEFYKFYLLIVLSLLLNSDVHSKQIKNS